MDFDVLLSESSVPSLSHVITLLQKTNRNSMVLFIMQIFAYRTVNEIDPMFLNRAFIFIYGVLIFSLIFSLPAELNQNTGVESSLTLEDIREYTTQVVQEVNRAKAST
jgi:hypothetical protein